MSPRLHFLSALLLLPTVAGAQAPLEVAPGRGFDPARLHFRADTARIFVIRNGEERPGPLQIEAISRGSWRGEPAIIHRIRVESSRMTMDDTTWYDPVTYAPIAHRSHGPRTIALDYDGLHVTGTIADGDGPPRSVDMTLTAPAFDPSALHAVLGSIEYRPGLTAELALFNHEQLAIVPTKVTVIGKEMLRTDGGPVEAWHLSVQFGARTAQYWIRAADGVDIKTVAEAGNGVSMLIAKGGAR